MSVTAPNPKSATEGPAGDSDIGAEKAEEFARQHPALVKFARVGWIAKGIVYTLTGVLALFIGLRAQEQVADGEGEASQSGAIARIAENSFGVTLLYVMAAGLVIYSLWRLVTVVLPAENSVKGWLTRAGYFVSAIVYLLLAWTAVLFARNPNRPEDQEDRKVEGFTRDLLDSGAGRALLVLVGVAMVVIAGVFLWKALKATFTSELLPGSVGPVSHHMLVTLGRIGWVGRSAMMALIGVLLTQAAINYDAEEAQGLDGSLRQAAESTVGRILVVVVGAGLLVYGVFCALSAPKQRLVGADS